MFACHEDAEEQEADPSWKGKVITYPHLSSHKGDKTLLPPEAGKTGTKRDYLTCFDPSTGVSFPLVPQDGDC